MRLPRFRFSMSTLFGAVAVVALNCGLYRRVYTLAEQGGGGSADSELSMLLGFFPLANGALIGTLRFVTRKRRSFRGGLGANADSSPAGFTYFNLHFLAIGCVIAMVALRRRSNAILQCSEAFQTG